MPNLRYLRLRRRNSSVSVIRWIHTHYVVPLILSTMMERAKQRKELASNLPRT